MGPALALACHSQAVEWHLHGMNLCNGHESIEHEIFLNSEQDFTPIERVCNAQAQ